MFIQSLIVCRSCTCLHRPLEVHAVLCKLQAKNKDVRFRSMLKKRNKKKDNPHLKSTWESSAERDDLQARVVCHSLATLELGWTRMVGHVFTCMFGA